MDEDIDRRHRGRGPDEKQSETDRLIGRLERLLVEYRKELGR